MVNWIEDFLNRILSLFRENWPETTQKAHQERDKVSKLLFIRLPTIATSLGLAFRDP